MTGAAVPAPPQFRCVPGQTGIAIHTRRLPTAIGVGVKIKVNGYQVPNAQWGANFLPGPPGTHTVTVDSTQWGMDYGGSFATVQVIAGHTTELYYTAPAQIYMRGALAAERRSAPGLMITYIVLAFVMLMLVAWVAMIIA